MSNYVAGNITFAVGTTAGVGGTQGTDRAANGTFTENIVAASSGDFAMIADLNFDGDIDNVSAFLLNIG